MADKNELIDVCTDLIRLVEGVGCKDWRDQNGQRFKDTNEWVRAYVAINNARKESREQATPPADAALADEIDSLGFVIRGDDPPVKEWVSELGGGCMPATKEEKMMWDVLQSALRARAVPQSAPAGFVEWLCQEMPPGTVISDPAWWAPKIHRAMLAASKEDGK